MSFTIVKFFYILFTTVKAYYQRQIPSVTTAIVNEFQLMVQFCLLLKKQTPLAVIKDVKIVKNQNGGL